MSSPRRILHIDIRLAKGRTLKSFEVGAHIAHTEQERFFAKRGPARKRCRRESYEGPHAPALRFVGRSHGMPVPKPEALERSCSRQLQGVGHLTTTEVLGLAEAFKRPGMAVSLELPKIEWRHPRCRAHAPRRSLCPCAQGARMAASRSNQ
jgi:hypothetical protein